MDIGEIQRNFFSLYELYLLGDPIVFQKACGADPGE